MKKLLIISFLIPQLGFSQSEITFNKKDTIISSHQKKITTLLLDYKKRLKRTGGIQGWKVQIKFADKREDIISYQLKFNLLYPNIATQITFESPYYKLTTGNFRSKNEALKLKNYISKNFPGAHHVSSIINLDLSKENF
tara:strand:- start:450 stop:866 length:417 start_codon:yes stop_codon:yes gene_type:complete